MTLLCVVSDVLPIVPLEHLFIENSLVNVTVR